MLSTSSEPSASPLRRLDALPAWVGWGVGSLIGGLLAVGHFQETEFAKGGGNAGLLAFALAFLWFLLLDFLPGAGVVLGWLSAYLLPDSILFFLIWLALLLVFSLVSVLTHRHAWQKACLSALVSVVPIIILAESNLPDSGTAPWWFAAGLVALGAAAFLSFRRGYGALPSLSTGLVFAGLSALQLLPSLAVRATGSVVLLVSATSWVALRSEPVTEIVRRPPLPTEPPPEPAPPPREETEWERKRKGVARWLETVDLPAGSFLMGSPEEEEGRFPSESPQHLVQVSAFRCMRFAVTRQLYATVVSEEKSEDEEGDRPVTRVSWWDAITFCNRLSELEGLERCYDRKAEGEIVWNRAANGYRLPSEAEWEYACRAGTQTRWSFGDAEEGFSDHAWYGGNSGFELHPAGLKKPNPWGLYDVHGNVFEWCWDWYGPYPSAQDPSVDPSDPSAGDGRVLRGGSFVIEPRVLRSAFRVGGRPGDRSEVIGFRCVLSPRRQP